MKQEESQNVEYKASWDDKCIAWICGYANAKGGTMYIGIDDKTKQPIGLNNPKKLMEDIPNKIRNATGIVADVALLRIQGKDVISVTVESSEYPICYHGKFYYRTGSVNMELTGIALTRFVLEKAKKGWDEVETFGGYMKDKHKFTALVAEMYKKRGIEMTDNDFVSFGLAFPDGKLTNTGALFADDCPLTHSRVFCTRWNGLTMAAKEMDIIDTQEYSGGLLTIMQYAEDFVRLNSRHSWHKLPSTRLEFDEYPNRAVHEAIVNAFIHRDYIITGSEVHIDIFDDRLEITSPGEMPLEKKLEEYDVHNIPSVRRNKLIADMCERLQITERRGSGFKKIFEDYEKISINPAKRMPKLEGKSYYFRITLPNLMYGFSNRQLIDYGENRENSKEIFPDLPKVTPSLIKPSEAILDDIQRRILRTLKGKVMSTSQLALTVGISRPQNLRRRYLRLLIDMGLIEYTLKNTPNSRLQKYRLTVRGFSLNEKFIKFESLNGEDNESINGLANDTAYTTNGGADTINGGASGGVNTTNGGINEALNKEVNFLYKVIIIHPGKRANELSRLTNKGLRTIERNIQILKKHGKIEYRGAPKSGGYYAIKEK